MREIPLIDLTMDGIPLADALAVFDSQFLLNQERKVESTLVRQLFGLRSADWVGEWSGEAAQDVVRGIRKECARLLDETAQWLPAEQWLWYLRRAPDEFFELRPQAVVQRKSTRSELRRILESWSSRSRARSTEVADPRVEQIFYPIGSHELAALETLRIYAGVHKTMSSIHRALAKGISLRVRPPGLVSICPTPNQRAALSHYDDRINKSGGLFSGLGVWGTSGAPPDKPHMCLPVVSVPRDDVPSEAFPELPPAHLVRGRFGIFTLDLEPIAPAIRSQEHLGTWSMSPRDLSCLCGLLYALLPMRQELPKFHSAIARQGYVRLGVKRLSYFLEIGAAILRTSILGELDEVKKSEWRIDIGELARLSDYHSDRLPRVLVPIPGGYLVDFFAASNRFLMLELDRSVTGGASGWRARSFEELVQDVIDQTDWKPTGALRDYIRKSLCNNGSVITDIDGIGARGGTLLLVDAASTVVSRAFDDGEYRAVRNVMTGVHDKYLHWQRRLAQIRSMRKGANFDFTEFIDIRGVVCTSAVAYLEDPACRHEVLPGLPAVCTPAELSMALGMSGASDTVRI